jgi:glutaredoxin
VVRVNTDYVTEIPANWQATLANGANKSSKPGDWKNRPVDLDSLKHTLTHHVIGPKDGSCFLQGNAVDGVRQAKAMERLFIVGIDVDNGMPSEEIDEIVRGKGLFCIRYTTHSHGKDYTEVQKDAWVKYLRANDDADISEFLITKKRYLPEIAEQAVIDGEEMTAQGPILRVTHPAMDKNRLIFILSKPWAVKDYDTQEEALRAWKDAYMAFAGWLGIAVDQSCTDTARLFYKPRRERDALYEAVVHEGGAIDIFAIPKGGTNRFIEAAAEMGATTSVSPLRHWAVQKAKRFLICDAIEEYCPEIRRPDADNGVIRIIECPFEGEHTSPGGAGTHVMNAGDGNEALSFVVKCKHNSCVERGSLDFLAEMERLKWLPEEARNDPRFLLEIEEDEEEAQAGAAVRAAAEAVSDLEERRPERPTLDMVKDVSSASEFLKILAESGATVIDAARDFELLARKMKDDLSADLQKTEIVKMFNRFATEDNRRRREARRELEKKREILEREAKRRQKTEARENEATAKRESREKYKEEEKASSEVPVIFVDTIHHKDAVKISLTALAAKNNAEPKIFRSAGSISRVVRDELNTPRAERMGIEEMRFELSNVARYLETSSEGFREVPATNNVVKHILADPALPLPVLGGIVTAPVFGADGKIRTKTGYDTSSELYFEPPEGLVIPPVTPQPNGEEVAKAVDLLMGNALVDFPFDGPNAGQSERAHALCMVLQPFARQLISGPTPIYLIVKPTPGTGASKLVNIYSLISTGEEATAQTETRSEDEIRKRVTSVLMQARPTFYLDNINYKIDSSALASAVTSPFWEDRLLGESRTIRVPVKHTWIFAGNNVTMSNEIARRCIRIHLDAKVERPELRTSFKHKDLEEWVRQNRGELIWACLTLIQNWIAKGRPEGDGVKGSFEAWSRVMGGILHTTGIEGFLANDRELREDADEEGNAIKSLISLWWENHRDHPVTVGATPGESGLFDMIEDEEIPLPIQGVTPQQRKISFGKYVGKLDGRIFTIDTDNGGTISVRIDKAGKKDNKVRWKLARLP